MDTSQSNESKDNVKNISFFTLNKYWSRFNLIIIFINLNIST